MKRCSVSLVVRGMQIKTTVRCHFTPSGLEDISAGPNQDGAAAKGTHSVGGERG